MWNYLVMIIGLVTGALIDLCGFNYLPSAWAQDSTEFLYIDCGSRASYIDPFTGIQWEPDAAYITAGKNYESVDGTGYPEFPELKTLRFFDNGRVKNCYSLPVTPNSTYMLRATFLYGNYDKAGKPPTFDLSLDASIVERVSTFSDVPAYREFTYKSVSNVTYLCLSQIVPQATPFISAIALKPSDAYYSVNGDYLDNGIYFSARTRVNFGGSQLIRFPQDRFDRYWYPHGVNSSYLKFTTSPLHTLTTSHSITRWSKYAPPETVFQSAIAAGSGNTITALMLSPDSRPYQYLGNDSYGSTWLAVHFAELDPSANMTTRQFYTREPGNPLVAFTNTFKSSGAFAGSAWFFGYTGPDQENGIYVGPDSTFFITPTAESMWGPIVNAMELFSIATFSSKKTVESEAFAIESIKSSMNLTEWSGDPCLPYPYPWVTCSFPQNNVQTQPHITAVNLSGYNLTGVIPPRFADLTRLTSLSLESNELTGWLPDLSSLANLKALDLANNNLSGVLPDWLALLTHLGELYVQGNNFTGIIPAALLSPNHLINFVYRPGNPLLSDGNGNIESGGPSSESSAGFTGGSIVGIVLGVVGLVILITIVCYLWFQYKSRHCGSSSPNESIRGNVKAYSLTEVALLTGNFGHQIGRGGFGPVYHGKLPQSGLEVAVKVSDALLGQGETEFLNEVSILSRVHHRYLVELVGYCQAENKHILIYEYMRNGSLHDHLNGDAENAMITALTWKMRLQIALHAAQGLEYLHTGCRPSFIHRDVKSSNILLDSKYEAKVADFGLTKLVGDEASGVLTDVRGTFGYLDPEYYTSGYLTTKSDVFSFGVVLLELITGRPPVSQGIANQPPVHIRDWVRSCLRNGSIDIVVDAAVKPLHPNPNPNAVWKVAEIALQCVEAKSLDRPTMPQVVQELHQAVALQG